MLIKIYILTGISFMEGDSWVNEFLFTLLTSTA